MAGYTSGEWEARERAPKEPQSRPRDQEPRGDPVGQRVKPEPAVEKSLVGSVAELIKEAPPARDAAEKVEWARLLPKDPALPDTILLAIGLARGYQIWGLGPEGECDELLSDRQGPIKLLRLLPKPRAKDAFSEARPVLALVDSVSAVAGRLHSTLSFLSLATGHHLAPLSFAQPIAALHVSDRYLAVAFPAQVSVVGAGTLTELFSVSNCCVAEEGGVALDLGGRWLAFADSRLAPSFASQGGVHSEQAFPAYAAHIISAANNLRSTVSSLSDSLSRSSSSSPAPSPASRSAPAALTVLDPELWNPAHTDIHSLPRSAGDKTSPVLFHFAAMRDQPMRWLKFGPHSELVVCAAESGQYLNVFGLRAHPGGSALARAVHLYTLFRGTTPASILHIAVSHDARWVAASTNHGTTHLFPITPYGGPLTLRTHAGPGLVNRHSRFHRSAGIDPRLKPELAEPSPPAATSPLASPGASGRSVPHSPGHLGPILVQAAAKVHQQLLPGGVGAWAGELSEGLASKRRSSLGSDSFGVGSGASALFDLPRTALTGPNRYCSLFLGAASGQMWEYGMEVVGAGPAGHTQAPDAPFTVNLSPAATWSLQRTKSSPDVRAPLSKQSPLRPASSKTLAAANKAKKSSSETSCAWISQVEMATYQSPARRLWQGPQFTFRTFVSEHKSQPLEKAAEKAVEKPEERCVEERGSPQDSPKPPSRTGSGKKAGKGKKKGKKREEEESLAEPLSEAATEVVAVPLSRSPQLARTAPMAIRACGPAGTAGQRVPVVLEASSVGSYDPGAGVTTEVCGSWADSDHLNAGEVDGRLRETIAEAMRTTAASLKGSSCGDSDMEDARDSFSDNDSTLLHSLHP